MFVVAVGCTTDQSPPIGPTAGPVQMNDVSVLFPLSSAPSVYPAASTMGVGGPLLPEALYTAVGGIAGSTQLENGGPDSDNATYDSLHVVAMRLDPCFAALAPDPHGTGCVAQLRLIFQSITAVGTTGSFAADSAVHAFYTISRAELIEIATAIGQARAASSNGERLGGLAPHPIMVEQGADGAMAHAVYDLIVAHAGPSNLTRVTTLSATDPDFLWTFQGFDVTDAMAAVVTPMVIPTLGGAEQQQFVSEELTDAGSDSGSGSGSGETDGTEQFTPATSSADNFEPLASANTAQQLTPTELHTAFEGLVHVDHPARNSPNTIDCASCHLATPTEMTVAEPLFQLVEANAPDAFTADGVYVLPSEMKPTFNQGAELNIHSFSYVGADFAVNQRTVNETAAIVAYLNQAGL